MNVVVDGIRFSLTPEATGVWWENGREVRVAVVRCCHPGRYGVKVYAGETWNVVVRLEDGMQVPASDSDYANHRGLPSEIEARVVSLLQQATLKHTPRPE